MDAFFSWRRTSGSDICECLKLHPAKNGAENIGILAATDAWRQLLGLTDASRSAVVELHSKGAVEIVGFGLAVFVKKSFVDAEVLNPKPGLNSRIIESVASGHSVIATYEEVRDANTQGELQQVILDTSWKNNRLSATQRDEVRVLLGRAYQELLLGYGLSMILVELVDELDLWHIEGHRSFRIIDRFEAYRQANPETTWNCDRALATVTSESMRDDPHSVAACLFHHRPQPRFPFTRGEQLLLGLAIEGFDDASMAKLLFVTVPAIKRRWERIFERVALIEPDLCPQDGEGTRGVQKRQRIATYIRNHPQELRPFNFSSHRETSG